MGEVGLRLVQRGEGVKDRRQAHAEALDLRKDEPHPVALLAARAKLGADLAVDRLLRVDEALQVEGIGHPNLALRGVTNAVTAPEENPLRARPPRWPRIPCARPRAQRPSRNCRAGV